MRSSCGTDPLVHYGRHFGRTVHALCTVSSLLNNGILRIGELVDKPDDAFTHEYAVFCFTFGTRSSLSPRERREHRIFRQLLGMIPGLEERLMEGSNEDITHIGDLVCHVYNSIHSDDI
jgi:hypothetical protein